MIHRLSRNARFDAFLVLALLTAAIVGGACAKKTVVPHPNQINAFDGQTYDTLVTSQAALDEAKKQFAAGKLPAGSKDVINGAGTSYEAARSAWMTWRDIYQGTKPGDQAAAQAALTADMSSLAVAIANVVKLTGGK